MVAKFQIDSDKIRLRVSRFPPRISMIDTYFNLLPLHGDVASSVAGGSRVDLH